MKFFDNMGMRISRAKARRIDKWTMAQAALAAKFEKHDLKYVSESPLHGSAVLTAPEFIKDGYAFKLAHLNHTNAARILDGLDGKQVTRQQVLEWLGSYVPKKTRSKRKR